MKEIVEQIKKEFAPVKPGASELEIKNTLKNIQRQLNKKIMTDRKNAAVIGRISADLSNLVESQLTFYNMNQAKMVEKFDDSFFRSFEILKKELFTLLAQPGDETQH